MPPIVLAAWLGEMIGLAIAAASDVRRRIIPDRVVLLLAANGLAMRLSAPGWRPVAFSLSVAVAILLLLGQVARLRLIGPGDAKLIATIAVFVPVRDVPTLLLAIALAGGVVSCVYLALRATFPLAAIPERGALLGALHREQRRIAAGMPLPYALAIFLGTGWLGVAGLLQCFSAIRCSF